MSRDLLERLAAERDIFRQMHNYCRAIDRVDVELLRSVWHPDGTLNFEVDGLQGAAAELAAAVIARHLPLMIHQHQFTSPILEIRGDRAVSETSTMIVARSHPDPAGRVVDRHYLGRFLDRWSRRDGRWAIDHREAVCSFDWVQEVVDGRNGTRPSRPVEDAACELVATIGEPVMMNAIGQEWLDHDNPPVSG